ncbi:phosphoribosylamine--glycine ligase [Helicobacter mustelae]|uniref:Phosphoribosylamine--glycine ligase n=1 Tax=Helicobacter mustelae (strain ATCC 43772 / CCUG 25715 / CIP 103759 / LMG 18044 / NCTC 12198 / R85-136P) TaxID=679897 RepID=D3UHM9_HELM1|nr:phosphoribosylamine--glycine ligase [Helicobacter mustelae]CBG40001.1 phosphoribosylamine--glycine ligase [Helicobacter mustelae 12198]SQH71513.1 phosphoribosylamine--glycine ligase [Helicobacter mustelae]STP12638.1 phosphoribosylamine--glycine ligase [Helicobacter mustelae]
MKKKLLILGHGGREYAMGLHLLRDKNIDSLFFAPKNAATERLGKTFDFASHQELIEKIQEFGIDFVIIGPEAYIIDGLSNALKMAGIKVFGPSKEAGMLEGSKAYMKDFATRHNIPTARYIQTDDLTKAQDFLLTLKPPYVLKADGLCAGKGVWISNELSEAKEFLKEMLSGKAFGESGRRVVVEEFLQGFELSIFAICDGEDFVLLPACQDHKRLLDHDEGPNTGGMGAYAPAPSATPELLEKIQERILRPTLQGMIKEGNPYCGVLFAGIMVCEQDGELEPYLLEYNVRFGDPECEVLMPLLQTSLLEICEHTLSGNLKNLKLQISHKCALAVVLSSKNYPYGTSEPTLIEFENYRSSLGHFVFAGVDKKGGAFYATGGRVLLCVGVGDDIKEARDHAYELIKSVKFDGMHYRRDIGYRVL